MSLSVMPTLSTLDELKPVPVEHPSYFNRELSWLEFNERVLEEALDVRNPLLERVKFLAIFATNTDEFFMIRVAGIRQQIAAGVNTHTPDGVGPTEQLAAIRRVVNRVEGMQQACWNTDLCPHLATQGIHLLNYDELTPEQQEYCSVYFETDIFPVLTPLAFDPSHPFPHISNLSLNLAVVVNDPEEGEQFARVKVPEVLPRLIPISGGRCDTPPEVPAERRACFVWLEQVIAANVQKLFPGEEITEVYAFRVTRNADVEIEEEEAADLLQTIEEGVRQRRFGAAVRLAVDARMPARLRQLLLTNLKLAPEDLYEADGPLGLSSVMTLMKLDRPDLKDAPFYPLIPSVFKKTRSSDELFAAIRQHDILLHHPFDSFQPVVDFIEAAAEDPDVLAIKQTLYRVGSNSPIVRALMRARDMNKQVTVLVELKARFDEENNIIWARALERAGVHVVYGLVGLKTHAKLALVVRRENDIMRRYVHLGTGNYNAATARIYTDMGLMTCRPDIGADVSELFNVLTGYSRQREYRTLLVAPFMLRERIAGLIEREIAHAQAGHAGRIILKLNAVIDPRMIDLLYRASQAGVQIDMIVRGICGLRPGVPGMSDNIRVRSIVGRFLEHTRIYSFANAGKPQIYLGSADLMQRNLDRRIETLFPVEEPALMKRIMDVLYVYLRDTMRARVLLPDGSYVRVIPTPADEVLDSQMALITRRDVISD